MVSTLLDEQAVGHRYAEGTHVVVQHKLVIRHGLDEYVACAVGHADEVEITLQHSVLARCTVDGDVAEVRANALLAVLETEVVAIHNVPCAVGQDGLPVAGMNLYLIYIIARRVEEGRYAFCTAHTHVVLRCIASA